MNKTMLDLFVSKVPIPLDCSDIVAHIYLQVKVHENKVEGKAREVQEVLALEGSAMFEIIGRRVDRVIH